MDDAPLDVQAVLTEEGHSLGQNTPLGLLHDSALEGLRGVSLPDGHCLLEDDGPSVGLLRDEVDRGPGSWTWSP